ncbi:MAG TPA: NAD-dependent epimerase/dehydratase family protein [Arachidicoccus sp.]|nr:NAD-dependent epimerase/dehydratase family protein [Arachidicoccus sp.]
MKKRLLITGANGFVGSHLVEASLDNGFEVYAAVRKNSDLTYLKQDSVTLVYPDYSSPARLTALLDTHGITHIAHVAGMTKGKSLEDYNQANATITVVLAQAALAARRPIEKFVFVSSLAVMGPAQPGKPLSEGLTPQPLTFYGKSKWLAEQYLQKYPQLPLVTLRPTAVYGPRERDMLMVIKMVRKGWELYLGRTPQQLSFIYVTDLCQAILAALDSPQSGQTYLLSDGGDYGRYEFARLSKQVLHKKTIRLHLPVPIVAGVLGIIEKIRPGKLSIINKDKLQELTGSWSCNIDKAKKELGFTPRFPLEKGIGATIRWNIAEKWR